MAVPFLYNSEDRVNGEVMATRAVRFNANSGQEDAEWLLEHQDMIPAELRKFFLVFPGTKWRISDGYRYVPCLCWLGARWYLYFYWLDFDFSDYARLVAPGK